MSINTEDTSASYPPPDELRQLAKRVNQLLSRYIAVHDSTIARRFHWRELLPLPFLFRPVDYGAFRHEAESILAALRAEAAQLQEIACGGLEDCSTQVVRSLADYLGALAETVTILWAICDSLFQKSQGRRLGWGEYNKICDAYTNTIPLYQSAGGRLSKACREAWPGFFEE